MAIKISPAVQTNTPAAPPEPSADLSTPPWEEHVEESLTSQLGKGQITHELTNNLTKETQLVSSEEVLTPASKPIQRSKMAIVAVGGGLSLNIGNFSNAKVSVTLSLPCGIDEIDETYEKASDWVSEKIKAAAAGIVPEKKPTEEHI